MIPRTRLQAAAAVAVLATTGTLLCAVTAGAAVAATGCSTNVFKRELFSGTSFSGKAKKTDCDSTISENWGSGAPASGLPKENFGVRWSVSRDFGSGGPFSFAAESFDGIRVYLDGTRKIDLWKNVSTTQKKTVNVTVPKGKHTLRIDYVNWTGSAKVKFAYTPRTTKGVDKTAPLVPAGAAATYSASTRRATVTWSKNKEMDLAGYRVLRRPGGSATWTQVASTTGSSYADTPPATGETYYYEVRAHDRTGNVSAGSTDRPVTTVDRTPPAAPAGLTVRAVHTGTTLTWQKTAGASAYTVSRANAVSGTVTQLGPAPGTSFTDTTAPFGIAYVYRVAAVDAAGNTGPAATASGTRPVAVPVLVSATSTPDGDAVNLLWSVPRDADAPYFRLYRTLTSPVIRQNSTEHGCDMKLMRYEGDNALYGCEADNVETGRTYHYAVAAVSRSYPAESALSNEVAVTVRDTAPPAPVAGLTAEATEYGFVLDWEPGSEGDILRYTVHRGELLGDEDERVCFGSAVAYLGPKDTDYVDRILPDGTEYCYFVDVTDVHNNSSLRWTGSARAVPVTALDLTPSAETPEGSPVRLTATTAESGSEVELSWFAVTGATGYLVHRWNPATEAYERLTADPVATGTATGTGTGTGTYTYTDSTAARGTTHFYRVSALLADGSESAPAGDWAILPPVS
ncbi:PA14 domain-containing protein [Streptomyces sp. NPDC050804]|uniref:PA14 domain-containing protein n=1 Tax=Streptomyces sp. NPDC050804 TaxID=3154745 RepID=UPI00342F996D